VAERRTLVLGAAAVLGAALAAAGCGSSGASTAGTTTTAAAASSGTATGSPVSGSVSGPVVDVKGSTFTLTTSLSPTGKSTVDVGSGTVITEQATATRADLTNGTCVTAVGSRSKTGVVTASRITVIQPVNGQCASGFPRGNGTRPPGTFPPGGQRPPTGGQRPSTGGQRPPGGFGGSANFGFAFGAVSTADGSTLTVKGPRGTTKVTVPESAQIVKTEKVGSSAIAVKMCAFVRGTSTDKGVTVKAQDISLSKPGASGCTFGFRRP